MFRCTRNRFWSRFSNGRVLHGLQSWTVCPNLFHARVSAEFLGRIFATMALTPQHTYRVLTKRPNRMRDLLTDRRVQGAMQDALLDIQSRTRRIEVQPNEIVPLTP